MSELPEVIRDQVITELYRQADELSWELLSAREKKRQYQKWIEDPRVGGILRDFFDDHRMGTWIKDTPMKEYTRAQEGIGSMAKYARSRFPGPDVLIQQALGPEWTVAPNSVGDKPMHCIATRGKASRYVCWGRPNTFRDLIWAALKKAIAMPEKPLVIVTLQDGIAVSATERRNQSTIAAHCGLDITYIHRRLQRI